MLSLIVVETNNLLREGLSLLLNQEDDLQVLGTANNAEDAISLLRQNDQTDVLLTNLSFGSESAAELINWCQLNLANTTTIAMEERYTHDTLRVALLAGISSFALKKTSTIDLLEIIHRVADGKPNIPTAVQKLLVTGYLNPEVLKMSRRQRKSDRALTEKEREVLIMVAEGRTNKQIAKTQQVAIKTVEKHRSNFMAKLNLKNSAQVARYAVSHGMVSLIERLEEPMQGFKSPDDPESRLSEEINYPDEKDVLIRPVDLKGFW